MNRRKNEYFKVMIIGSGQGRAELVRAVRSIWFTAYLNNDIKEEFVQRGLIISSNNWPFSKKRLHAMSEEEKGKS